MVIPAFNVPYLPMIEPVIKAEVTRMDQVFGEGPAAVMEEFLRGFQHVEEQEKGRTSIILLAHTR